MGFDTNARGTIGVCNSSPVVFDTEFPNGTCRCIMSGVAGVIAVTYDDNSTDTIPIQAGFNPVRVKKISTAGTIAVTAGDLRAGY